MGDKYDTDGNPQLEPDLITWGRRFETADRRVALTEIGTARVSTVFLGLDHRFSFLSEDDQPPVFLFETVIFWKGHDLDQEQARYVTRDEALAGHEAMVARVRAAFV